MQKELKDPWNDIFNFNYIRAMKAGWFFEDLENLQKAIDKKGKLQKGYFKKPENKCIFVPAFDLPKSELRKIREDLIRELRIHAEVSSYRADQTMRLLHALAILREPNIVQASSDNEPMSYIRNSCISLCRLDNGSEEIWNLLIKTAISISALAEKLVVSRDSSSITEESVKDIFFGLECLKDLPGYEEAMSSSYSNLLNAIKP